jgi:hypothetical protein
MTDWYQLYAAPPGSQRSKAFQDGILLRLSGDIRTVDDEQRIFYLLRYASSFWLGAFTRRVSVVAVIATMV